MGRGEVSECAGRKAHARTRIQTSARRLQRHTSHSQRCKISFACRTRPSLTQQRVASAAHEEEERQPTGEAPRTSCVRFMTTISLSLSLSGPPPPSRDGRSPPPPLETKKSEKGTQTPKRTFRRIISLGQSEIYGRIVVIFSEPPFVPT